MVRERNKGYPTSLGRLVNESSSKELSIVAMKGLLVQVVLSMSLVDFRFSFYELWVELSQNELGAWESTPRFGRVSLSLFVAPMTG